MMPAATASVLTRPHLPIPPIIRRPTEQSFYRSRNHTQDFPSPSPIVTEPFRQQATIRGDPESSRNLDYEQENIASKQSKQRLSQQDENRFQNNQEGSNHLGLSQQQQRRSLNEEGIMGGTRSYQPNGSIINTRMVSDPLAPATDVYSYLNRLSELFPDLHPTQLQRVFDDCGRDFLRTIDNVLYARRFRKSVIAHMSKFRSLNRSQAQKNITLDSQQQERNSEDNIKNSQQPQPETQMRNSPKSRRLTRSASAQQSKRSRILAFTTPKTQRDSMKGGAKIIPRTIQSYPSLSGSTPLTQSNKKPSPPPNVFLHPVINDQQSSGNTNPTPRYMISLQRPHTLHYGAPPSISSNLTVPLVLDNSYFQNSLPLPTVRYPVLQDSTLSRNSSFTSPGSVDQHFLESAQEKQQQQPPRQPLEQIEQVPPTQQEMQKEQEIQKEAEQMDGAHISQATDLSYSSEHFEIVQQANEADTWSNLIKTFCEPLHTIDTEGNKLMMHFIPSGQNGDNETSHECENYLYRQMPQVIGDKVDKNDQGEVRKELNTSRSSESVLQENGGNQNDSTSAGDMQREGSSPLVARTQMFRKSTLTSLDCQSVTTDQKESTSNVPIEVAHEVVGHKQNLDQLILEDDSWTQNEENSEDRGNDLQLDESDEEYTHQ